MIKIFFMLTTIFFSFLSSSLWASTVKVSILKDGQLRQSGVAAAIADEVLIVNYSLVNQGNQIQVEDKETGATFVGNVLSTDSESDLALISVKGLQITHYNVAKAPLEIGRKVSLGLSANKVRDAVVRSILPADIKQPHTRVEHTAIIKENEFGAPLLNNCNEFAGVSLNNKKSIFDKRLTPSSPFSIATELNTTKSFLNKNKINFTEANDTCLSEEERLNKLESEKKEQQEKIKLTQEENKKREERIKRLEQEKAEKEKALEATEEEKKSKEIELQKKKEALEKTKKENEKQKEIIEKAEQEKAEQEKLEEMRKQEEAETKKLEDEKKQKDKERLLLIASGLTLAFLIFLLFVWFIMRRRRIQLKHAEQEASSKKHQLNVEKAKYEAAQSELEIASATFTDILFVGKDEEQNEHRIKIIGNTLARNPEGVFIGRSAQQNDYVISVDGVSRVHLCLTLNNEQLYVQDLGSFNGTAVNGHEIPANEKVAINNTDKLRIGTVSGNVRFFDE